MAPNDVDVKTNRKCCFWIFYSLKLVPVLFIFSVVVWSYYAYVVELCIYTITPTAKLISYLVIYHTILSVFLWSYWKTVFTKMGRVPERFRLPEGEYSQLVLAEDESVQQMILQNYSKDLPSNNCTISGGVRYCDKCKSIKPDRAHHCSVCGQCILKMDHHCPWVNNCISFNNYKYFILFLGYGLIYCTFITLTSLEYFIAFWKGYLVSDAKFHVLFLFFVAFMFGFSLLSLFCYHCHLVRYNRTTLEAFRPAIFQTGPDKNGYHLGAYANFREVFGENPRLWFFPVFTSKGNGILYRVQSRHQQGSYQSMDSTQTRLE